MSHQIQNINKDIKIILKKNYGHVLLNDGVTF